MWGFFRQQDKDILLSTSVGNIYLAVA